MNIRARPFREPAVVQLDRKALLGGISDDGLLVRSRLVKPVGTHVWLQVPGDDEPMFLEGEVSVVTDQGREGSEMTIRLYATARGFLRWLAETCTPGASRRQVTLAAPLRGN